MKNMNFIKIALAVLAGVVLLASVLLILYSFGCFG